MLKTKFSLYYDEKGKKRVSFPGFAIDGKTLDYSVAKDKDGNEYFYAPNPNPSDNKKEINHLVKFVFPASRPGDAIQSVLDGYADALQSGGVFQPSHALHPIIFVDREFGDKIRKTTSEGFKGTKWKYGISFRDHRSISCGHLIHRSNTEEKYILFNNEDYAKNGLESLQKRLDKKCIEYFKCHDSNKEDEFFHSIEGNIFNKIFIMAIFATEIEFGSIKRNYSLEVAQVIMK